MYNPFFQQEESQLQSEKMYSVNEPYDDVISVNFCHLVLFVVSCSGRTGRTVSLVLIVCLLFLHFGP